MNLSSKFGIVKNSMLLVFARPYYILVGIIAAFLMLSFSVLILNASLIFDPISMGYSAFSKVILLLKLLGGMITNNTFFSAAIMIITSLLAGINIALLAFRIKSLKSLNYKETGSSAGGTITSIMASGCSSCGISVLSMIGLAGGLTFLPFGGLEFGLIGIILLLFSIYWISKYL